MFEREREKEEIERDKRWRGRGFGEIAETNKLERGKLEGGNIGRAEVRGTSRKDKNTRERPGKEQLVLNFLSFCRMFFHTLQAV